MSVMKARAFKKKKAWSVVVALFCHCCRTIKKKNVQMNEKRQTGFSGKETAAVTQTRHIVEEAGDVGLSRPEM
jgi:hypothetical protein